MFTAHIILVALIVSCSVFASQESTDKPYYDVNKIADHFKDFVSKFDKHYETKEEFIHRLNIFETNVIEVNRNNRNSNGAKFDVNQFSDLTFEEFLAQHTGFNTKYVLNFNPVRPKRNTRSADKKISKDLPDELDYRKKNMVTEIKDQGDCGSCYAFSAIGNIEGLYAKKTGKLVALSEQHAVNCDLEDYGCEGGFPHTVISYLAKEGGSVSEESVPYKVDKLKCRTNKTNIVAQVVDSKILDIVNEDELKEELVKYGPLSIAFTVNSMVAQYSSRILDPLTCDYSLNHGVVLVGYGKENDVPYWIIKNSWGTSWGEKGYLRIVRGKRACNVGDYVVTAILK